jgi:hypothetical protein
MKLLKEPLVHFLVLATLLFVLNYIFSSTQKEKIVVDQQTVDFLVKQREDLELSKLSPEERRQTIDSFIEDEILYKEAYKRGLNKGDSRMRRNMILKMRGLLVGDIKEPTDTELREYFKANRVKFSLPPTLSLEHVYFPDPSIAPEGVLRELRAGRDPSSFGEPRLGLGRSLSRLSQRQLVETFDPQAARSILAIEDDQWHGPFESIRGVHFVRVVGQEPARAARYQDVKSYLGADWMMTLSRKRIDQELQRLRDDYEVVVEGM